MGGALKLPGHRKIVANRIFARQTDSIGGRWQRMGRDRADNNKQQNEHQASTPGKRRPEYRGNQQEYHAKYTDFTCGVQAGINIRQPDEPQHTDSWKKSSRKQGRNSNEL